MKRISQLDGLRGLAILMVFLYHAVKVPLFWSGVDLFFVLSGYLITGILLRMKETVEADESAGFFGPFYARRARRILPPYLLFLVMASLSFPVPWSHVWFWYAFFAANVANSLQQAIWAMLPLWSLAVEEQFYFVWPWVARRASRQTLKKIALGIMLVAPILRAIFTPFMPSYVPIYVLTPFRADLLACGAFIAVSELEEPAWIKLHRRLAGRCTIAAGIVLASLSILHSFRHDGNSVFFNTLGYSLLVVIFGGALIWVLGTEKGLTYTFLNAKPLRYMGLISYTFYLYHEGVLTLVERQFHSLFLTAVVSFAITMAISGISWIFFESWILGKRVPGQHRHPQLAQATSRMGLDA